MIRELLGGSEDPKEEAIGDCVEICFGILRIALMYEGCEQKLLLDGQKSTRS